MCLGVILSKVLFAGCMTLVKTNPTHAVRGQGSTAPGSCTDRSLQLTVLYLGATGPCQVEKMSNIKFALYKSVPGLYA